MEPLRFRMVNRGSGKEVTIGEAIVHEGARIFLRSTGMDIPFGKAGDAPVGLPEKLLAKLEELGIQRMLHHHTGTDRVLETSLELYLKHGRVLNYRPDLFGDRSYLDRHYWTVIPKGTLDVTDHPQAKEVSLGQDVCRGLKLTVEDGL